MPSKSPLAGAKTGLIALYLLACALAAAAGDFGGVLGGAARQVQNAKESGIPSGAATYLKQIDQALDRTDRMMGAQTANLTPQDRVQSAAAALQEAAEKLKLVESRYGSKMGLEHPDLVKRRERIAAGEKALATFRGGMNQAIQQEQAARDAADQAEITAQAKQKEETAKARAEGTKNQANGPAAGGIIFSKSPLNPAQPANLTAQFQAGDSIYGLIRAGKSWRELYGATDKKELAIMVVMAIGENKTLQYVTLKKAAQMDSSYLVLDIAPAPELMTAYKDPDIQFGEGKGNRKIGPVAYTYELAQLPAGKHKIEFYVQNYGEKLAAGEFEISGASYQCYAELHEKVKAACESAATLPPAGMVNRELEAQMRKLAENAGWNNILRVVIIDQDWWLEGSASRYLNVAMAAKDAGGKYYWRNLQFSQPKLITGAWGALELSKTGIKRSLSEENLNK